MAIPGDSAPGVPGPPIAAVAAGIQERLNQLRLAVAGFGVSLPPPDLATTISEA